MSHIIVDSRIGQFTILLCADRAPVTCAYFSDLVHNGALHQSSIFRILSESNQQANDPCPIHVVQMGPKQCLTGDKHAIKHEGTDLTGISHKKWTVSAARLRLGELFGSFFICMCDEPSLDHGGLRQPDGQGFAAFGHVVAGFETIERVYRRVESEEWLKDEIPIDTMSLHDPD
jgi:peptidyl-prolyl cis-trans isomerase A (cyclophilin A)